MVGIYPDDVCWRCHKDYADCECPSYKELNQENIQLRERIKELEEKANMYSKALEKIAKHSSGMSCCIIAEQALFVQKLEEEENT